MGQGDVGNLTVEVAKNLTLQDGGRIITTTFGQGNAGNLTVSAKNIEIIGGKNLTGLFASTHEKGNGGNMTVTVAENLTLRGRAVISTSNFGQGNAGNLTVSARNIGIIGGENLTGLFARGFPQATGAAGTITIYTETLNLRNEANIEVQSATQQPAGDLRINSNNIRIENQASLTAESK